MNIGSFELMQTKVKTRGLLLFLALISIIGFTLSALNIYFGTTIPSTIQYASILLGFGLIYESKAITKFVFQKKRVVFDLPKIITFIVGATIFFGGIFSSIGFVLTPEIEGAVGLANIIAIGVIIAEIFWID